MTQTLSNLISSLPGNASSRSSSRFADSTSQQTSEHFDQVLSQNQSIAQSASQQTLESTPPKPEKAPEKQAKNDKSDKDQNVDDSDQMTDDQAVDQVQNAASDDADPKQDRDVHHDHVTDTALVASAVQVTTLTPQTKQPVSTSTNSTTQQVVDATAQTDDDAVTATEQGAASDGAQISEDGDKQKPASAGDAMLRMLHVSSGQQNNTAQSTLTLTDAQAVQAPAQQHAAGNTQAAQVPLPQDSSQQQDTANVARVSRALHNAIHQKGGTITIRMMPPELGQVRVDIQMHGGRVSASFQTEHESVQTLMRREMSQLRQALEKQGLTVDRLQVSQRPTSSSHANASGQDSQQQQSPSDGRSRGQYARQQSQQQSDNRNTDAPRQSSFATQLSSQD